MKILGYEYKIIHKPKKKIMGDCNSSKLKITIDSKQASQQKESTMLHEILHALSDHLDLNLTENQVRVLESGLYQTLIDNGVDLSPLARELIDDTLG